MPNLYPARLLSKPTPQSHDSILRTKLHRPVLPVDFVFRPRLQEILNQGLKAPLTLVSAPAGYGKSLLVSDWVESRDEPCAWLSLDGSESDVGLFLDYLLAAVETLFADACPQTRLLTRASELPPMRVLAGSLVNELDALETPFLLVLDDYHRIDGASEVHELLRQLLTHPPRPLRLVLISRRDPPLQLNSLRAQAQITELRTQDLRFTTEETKALLQRILAFTGSDEALANLQHEVEGWVVGLRLISLALRQTEDRDAFLKKLHGSIQYIQEYLIHEVIARQAPHMQDWLLQTSILDRFCPELCDAVCALERGAAAAEFGGVEFMRALQEGNLFAIALDTRGEWFRYHHLFQQLLQRELKGRMAPDAIAALHARAGEWFERQGLIEEAIRHALAAGEVIGAAEIFERHRHGELNQDRWYVAQRWLALFPAEITQQRPALLLARAWTLVQQYRLLEIHPILARAESILADETADPALLGELDFYRSILLIWLQGNGEGALKRLEEARKRVPATHRMIAAEIEFWRALARQMTGGGKLAIESLEENIRATDSSEVMSLSRLVGAQIFVHLLSGDLSAAVRATRRVRAVSSGNAYAKAWSHYLEANTEFQAYHLDEALRGFVYAAKWRNILNRKAAVDSLAGLVLTYQAMQRPDDAVAAMEQFLEFAREPGDPQHLAVAESCQARLSLLQDDLTPAIHWARSCHAELHAPGMFFWLEVPSITQARVQIAMGNDKSLAKALESLGSLRQQVEILHFNCQTIEILVLQSLALEKLGRADEAFTVLEQAAALAEPRGWLRPFVEAGPSMTGLLRRLVDQGDHREFAVRLLDVLTDAGREGEPGATTAPHAVWVAASSLAESLTAREFDVLEFLTQRLRNKEIAARLSISPETVKSHLQHLYKKLGVSTRRQAVVRAVELKPFLNSHRSAGIHPPKQRLRND